jgi:hypothetical protein
MGNLNMKHVSDMFFSLSFGKPTQKENSLDAKEVYRQEANRANSSVPIYPNSQQTGL